MTNVKTIDNHEFLKRIRAEPTWTRDPEEETVVEGLLTVQNAHIEEISEKFTFLGEQEGIDPENPKENLGRLAVSFDNCPKLKRIKGTYHGAVVIGECKKLRQIDINVTSPDGQGRALTVVGKKVSGRIWNGQPELETVEGSFHGSVNLNCSNIREVKNLRVVEAENNGIGLLVQYCPNLIKIQADLNGLPCFLYCPELKDIQKVTVQPDLMQRWKGTDDREKVGREIEGVRYYDSTKPLLRHLPSLTEFNPKILEEPEWRIYTKLHVQLEETLAQKVKARNALRRKDTLL